MHCARRTDTSLDGGSTNVDPVKIFVHVMRPEKIGGGAAHSVGIAVEGQSNPVENLARAGLALSAALSVVISIGLPAGSSGKLATARSGPAPSL